MTAPKIKGVRFFDPLGIYYPALIHIYWFRLIKRWFSVPWFSICNNLINPVNT